ncbi:MAG TPA: AFG1/ZapE family ATPase, partial [Reyranellaceae bacterium]|nr:AFG1/ZapE family ATPase [Reyranellaceae bacterium]
MDSPVPSTGQGPQANLANRRATGDVHADPVQERIVARLQALHEALGAARPAPKRGFLAKLLGGGKPLSTPPGIYIWGPVGRGKSMLMDL